MQSPLEHDRMDKKIAPSSRDDAVRFAMCNARLSGCEVSDEAKALLQSWACGEISDDKLIEASRQRNGVAA
jgi:hypothetical protein